MDLCFSRSTRGEEGGLRHDNFTLDNYETEAAKILCTLKVGNPEVESSADKVLDDGASSRVVPGKAKSRERVAIQKAERIESPGKSARFSRRSRGGTRGRMGNRLVGLS
jgi:hypothetical protein